MDEYESESEGKEDNVRYFFLLFVAFPFLFRKESNRLTNMGEITKNLNHLIYISQIYYSEKY